MRRRQPIRRGVSLIEAVVALAVMAFGMLAYVGLQSTLRFNGDVAKQRAEAVRLAQEAIERWRSYAAIETDGTLVDYAEIATQPAESVAPPDSNTTFTRTITVADAATTASAPRAKTVTVDVAWQDRNGETQTVRLGTTITAIPPELAGTLAIPSGGSPLRQPQGRSPNIPQAAKDLGGGISAYKPPGASGSTVALVFDNQTGVIVGLCTTAVSQESLMLADVSSCIGNRNGLALSGFVRFATGSTQPTVADAENPTGTPLNLLVLLTLTSIGHASPDHLCFADAPASASTTSTAVPYFCAIFFVAGATPVWSGISTLTPLGFTDPTSLPAWEVAVDAADATSTRYRVCRYTPAANDSVPVPNRDHPRSYTNVPANEPLRNQNFLVIRAGDDTTPFQCPTDGPADPAAGDLVNSNSLLHQPAPASP